MWKKILTPFIQPNVIFNSWCTNVQGHTAATEKTQVLSVRPKKRFCRKQIRFYRIFFKCRSDFVHINMFYRPYIFNLTSSLYIFFLLSIGWPTLKFISSKTAGSLCLISKQSGYENLPCWRLNSPHTHMCTHILMHAHTLCSDLSVW